MVGLLVEKEKLTDWENEPSVQDLKKNIDDADNDQQIHLLNVKRWLSKIGRAHV